MNILIICVNYCSNESLNTYLASINEAEIKNICIDIKVVDNTPDNIFTLSDELTNIHDIQIINNINNGYLGGVSKVYNNIDKKPYDYIIISNVDLTVKKDFFKKLACVNVNPHIGWIAPSIYSFSQQRDMNPKIISRLSAKRIKALILLYSIPILYNFYLQTLYKRKRNTDKSNPKDIYAGHGSFIILTNEFSRSCPYIDYPIFLFGEEQYLAEECRSNKLKVVYNPALIVYDKEHESTGKLKNKIYCDYNKKAQQYILKKFYEQN